MEMEQDTTPTPADSSPSSPADSGLDRFCGRSFEPIPKGAGVLVVTMPWLVRLLLDFESQGDEGAAKIISDGLLGMMEAAQANPVLGVLAGTVVEVGGKDALGLCRLNVVLAEPAELILETEARLTEALGGRPDDADESDDDGDGGMLGGLLSALGALNPEAFEREHPWFGRVGLSAEERYELLRPLGRRRLEEVAKELGKEEMEALAAATPGLEEALDKALLEEDRDQALGLFVSALRARALRKPSERFYLAFPDDAANRRMLRIAFHGILQKAAADNGAMKNGRVGGVFRNV